MMTAVEKIRSYFEKAVFYIKNILIKAKKGFVGFSVIFTLVVIAVGIGAGTVWVKSFAKEPEKTEIVETKENENDSKLPGEIEKRIVTVEEIETSLAKIGQLSTYYGSYKVTKEVEHSRYFIDDWKIPLTKNVIHLECEGIVKVGYDIEKITPVVDNDSQKIYIYLPEPKVLDNYVIWDSVRCEETNNILNPIDFEQYQILIVEIEEQGLADAKEKGIYNDAEENLKKIVEGFLSGFEEYDIEFV